MKRILQMAVVATSGMTFFSYIAARVFKENFLETRLLNQLIFPASKERKKNHPAGFAVHYAVGIFFSSLYYRLWKDKMLHPKNFKIITMGLINGIVGVMGWHSIFFLHSKPPVVDLRRFSLQLIAAHTVFGYLNGLVFRRIVGQK